MRTPDLRSPGHVWSVATNGEIELTSLDQVADLRLLYARELVDKIRYEREGRTRIYGVRSAGAVIGYGILHGTPRFSSKPIGRE